MIPGRRLSQISFRHQSIEHHDKMRDVAHTLIGRESIRYVDGTFGRIVGVTTTADGVFLVTQETKR